MYYFPTRLDMVMALLKPGMRIAEVGVWKGEFAHMLTNTCPFELVLIDPWKGVVPSGDADGNNVCNANLEEIFEGIQDWEEPYIVRRGYSYDVLPKYPDNYFDAIYIDGDHGFEGCYKDLELAYKKVKPGGWIMGHDYGQNFLKTRNVYHFGVQNAVDTFCIRYRQKIVALGLDGCVSFAIRLEKGTS